MFACRGYPMIRFRVALVALSALALAGCLSTKLVSDDFAGPTAVLADSSANLIVPKFKLFSLRRFVTPPKIDFFYAYKIDGKIINNIASKTASRNQGRGFSLEVEPHERRLPVKPLSVELVGTTYHAAEIGGIFDESYFVNGTVMFTPAEGARYVVRGILGKGYSGVWIETADGRVVSEKIEKRD